MDKIVGIGNALTDILVNIEDDSFLKRLNVNKGGVRFIDKEEFATTNETIARMNPYYSTGGSAGNTIRALSMLGLECGFIGKAGNDRYGEFYRKDFDKLGITTHILCGDLPSGAAITFISPDGERTFIDYLGAASTLEETDLSIDMFKDSTCLYLEGYLVQNHNMIIKAAELARQAGLQICIDLANADVVKSELDFFKQLVTKYVDIVFANEEEAKAFTGKSPEKALEDISKMCSITVVKAGKKGAYIKKGCDTMHICAEKVDKVIDTTGAGDYFAAGFIYGLACGYSMEKCGKIASLLSGHIIQTIGTTLPEDTWGRIKEGINNIIS